MQFRITRCFAIAPVTRALLTIIIIIIVSNDDLSVACSETLCQVTLYSVFTNRDCYK